MKKLKVLFFLLLINNIIGAQTRIELAAEYRGADIQESTLKELKTVFSFKSIESESVETERGVFSVISMDRTISGGNYGAPSLPIARELVAVPFGATPIVKVLNYSVTDYKLDDYGIERIYPQQQSMSKSAKPEDRVFHYDESAYQVRALANAPKTSVELLGTMRGIRLGALQVEPVCYNPANNTMRVFNDIEVEITFENADMILTEQTLLKTYSPYFDVVYKQLFNARAVSDFYDEHPDLMKSPVKMLVVANRMFEDVMQPWIEWKTQKGFYLDVKYTDEIGTTSEDIETYVKQQYADYAPTFLILFGDEDLLPPSVTSGFDTQKITDNYYAAVDDDYIPDMYCSRMCCETVDEMSALIEKVLQYEQYTMLDPSYLENALLIAGYDYWENPKVGQPTMEYISNYYVNEEHGYNNVYKYLDSPYTGCYNYLSSGVGYAHYTAHGLETCWDYPRFAVSDVNSLTNVGKYFWAIGNCCLSGDWGYDNSKSLGEAMICANKKGAWGYIGSCPVTWWWEDYYFAVGANKVTYEMPKYDETTMGCYDAWWSDSYNSLSSVMFTGNLAVAYSHLNDYPSSASSRYYYEAYHTLGDGSVMPYKAKPTANEVSHLYTIPYGAETFMIKAAPNSYVGISVDGVLYGAGMINESGTDNIPINNIPEGKEVMIVVSHPDHYPYVEKISSSVIEGKYLVMDSYRINDENGKLDSGDEVTISLDILNIGSSDADDVKVELYTDSEYIKLKQNAVTMPLVASGEKVSVEGLSLEVSPDVPNKTKIDFRLLVTSGDDSWEIMFSMAVYAPKLSINNIYVSDNDIAPGDVVTLKFEVRNDGGGTATDVFAELLCASEDIEITKNTFTKDVLAQGDVMYVATNITIPSTVPNGSMYQIGINASTTYYKASKIYELFIGSVIEDFETGDMTSYEWITEDSNGWTVTTENPYEGRYCIKSGNISNNPSVLKLTIEVLVDDELSFYRRLESPSFDMYSFYVDGEEMDVVSGTLDWEIYKQPIAKGVHELEWRFEKRRDASSTSAVNNAYVDYIKFPPTTVVLLDDINVSENNEGRQNVVCYPNPTSGMLNIGIEGDFDASVYNYQGQLLMKVNDNERQIDLSNLTSGMYFVEIRNEKYHIVEKIILK